MSIEIEDIMMELVKNIGESNKILLERVSKLEESSRNTATHVDMVELVKAVYRVNEDTQQIICYIADLDNSVGTIDILTKWDKFWSWLSRGKVIGGIIVAILAVVGAFVWFLIKWLPLLTKLFSGS